MDVLDRFWAKVVKTDGCWVWIGAHIPDGYGSFSANGRVGLAHRFSYTQFVGPIPEGLQLDHLCRNRTCVRPDHLEPVTSRENSLRGQTVAARHAAKTHCDAGHEFTEANILRTRLGNRQCRACRKVSADKTKQRPEYRAAEAARARSEAYRAYQREYAKRRAPRRRVDRECTPEDAVRTA